MLQGQHIQEQDGKPLPGGPSRCRRVATSPPSSRGAWQARQSGHNNPDFHYRNKGNLATVGRSYTIVEIGKLRLTGLVAWVIWLVIHIYYLIGFRNRVVALFQWAWTYITYSRCARLITFENNKQP